MDYFYLKKEQLNMILKGTVRKKSMNSTLLNASIGMLCYFLKIIKEKPRQNRTDQTTLLHPDEIWGQYFQLEVYVQSTFS